MFPQGMNSLLMNNRFLSPQVVCILSLLKYMNKTDDKALKYLCSGDTSVPLALPTTRYETLPMRFFVLMLIKGIILALQI